MKNNYLIQSLHESLSAGLRALQTGGESDAHRKGRRCFKTLTRATVRTLHKDPVASQFEDMNCYVYDLSPLKIRFLGRFYSLQQLSLDSLKIRI